MNTNNLIGAAMLAVFFVGLFCVVARTAGFLPALGIFCGAFGSAAFIFVAIQLIKHA